MTRQNEEPASREQTAHPFRIAVFASGEGTNFQAVADAIRAGELDAELALLVCDKPGAKVVERARQAKVPVFVFRPKEFDSREAYEKEILAQLRKVHVDLVVLAGYMRLLTDVLVQAYPNRMINIHPSLLPAFPGLDAVGQALRHGVKVTGATVHFVDSGLDSGPIIAQVAVPVYDDDTRETLQARIREQEHSLYVRVIRWIREGKVAVEGRKVTIKK